MDAAVINESPTRYPRTNPTLDPLTNLLLSIHTLMQYLFPFRWTRRSLTDLALVEGDAVTVRQEGRSTGPVREGVVEEVRVCVCVCVSV